MRRYKVRIAPGARKDLEEIQDFLQNGGVSPARVDVVMREIKEAIRSLEIFPGASTPVGISKSVRSKSVAWYKIYFNLIERDGLIWVVRVIHMRRAVNEADLDAFEI